MKETRKQHPPLVIFSSLLLISLTLSSPSFAQDQTFVQCLSKKIPVDDVVFDQENSQTYSTLLKSSLQNLRFGTADAKKPKYIITPKNASHIQATIACAKKNGIQIRTRSGGHDYEGFSYTSQYDNPFLILDLSNFQNIDVDVETKTAWVEAGATLGQVYYAVGSASGTMGFPAGTCPTVGVGGHISGGGQGLLSRKYGLASDNVVDAVLVLSNGDIVDRKSMGEDLFWALRGGGAANFGVVLKWKLNLVPVPPKVTLCNIPKKAADGATKLVYQWQTIAPKLSADVNMRVVVFPGQGSVTALFSILYLGALDQLRPLLSENFADLGFEDSNCNEMSWLKSTVENQQDDVEVLKDRTHWEKVFFIGKSDYFNKPIPEDGLEEAFEVIQQDQAGVMIMDPYGAMMAKISDTDTPFPYRNSTLFNVQYYVRWQDGGDDATKTHMDWIDKLYETMTPYASQDPRAAYINYRDLSLGKYKNPSKATYDEAKTWGIRYFTEKNFKRLAQVKSEVDPDNFFRHEQSIPPLSTSGTGKLSSMSPAKSAEDGAPSSKGSSIEWTTTSLFVFLNLVFMVFKLFL